MKAGGINDAAQLRDLATRVSALSGDARTQALETEAKKLGVDVPDLEQRLVTAAKQGSAGAASIGTHYAAQHGAAGARKTNGTSLVDLMSTSKTELPEGAAKLAEQLDLGKASPAGLAAACARLAQRFGQSSEWVAARYEVLPFERGAVYQRKGGQAWRPVPAEVPAGASWSKLPASYAPIHYVGAEVQAQVNKGAKGEKTWAHPNKLDRQTLDAMVAKMVTHGPGGLEPVKQDPVTGLPLNPLGPTGISGRGESNLGPIHAQDMFVRTKHPETGESYAILIRRKDTGQWAMPGGIVDPKDGEAKVPAAVATALREFQEETGAEPSEEFAGYLMQAQTVFEGVCEKDPRNTDNMWFETRVMAAEVPWEVVSGFMKEAKGSDDASDARLVKLTPEVIGELYADHPAFVQRALDALG